MKGRNLLSQPTWVGRICMAALLLVLVVTSFVASSAPSSPESATPSTPREFFNAGVQQLRAGKLREAEASLESALSSQNERLQDPALYNLGHVRFDQGVEELKRGPAARPTAARGRSAAQQAQQAASDADAALAGDDVQKMVAAYIRGRGARKDLNAAAKAVQRALQSYGAALNKWQRASGDFKSALEMEPSDTDAQENAETTDRSIARLVDSVRELQQTAGAMGQKKQDLGDKLKQLKGRIPAPDMPPGAAGDDDEEEDLPNGFQPDQKEGASRQGEELSLSPEQAAWLLQGFQLESERRLPMGQKDTAEPRNRSRKPW
jgi:hypothetical protein